MSPTEDARTAFSVPTQTRNLTFTADPRKPRMFYVKNDKNILGKVPTVLTDWRSLVSHGTKEENRRGIIAYKGKGYDTITLKTVFDETTSPDVLQLCRMVHDDFCKEYDPVNKSTWWQSTFGFNDGTQVFKGTDCLTRPNGYLDYEFAEGNWEAPLRTCGRALYDETDTVHPWYAKVNVGTKKTSNGEKSSEIMILLDTKGNKIKTIRENAEKIYNTNGIHLNDADGLNLLADSEYFKSRKWKVKSAIQLTAIEWICDTDLVTGNKVVYPRFILRTHSSILFKEQDIKVSAERVANTELRQTMLDTLLFEGLESVSSITKKKETAAKKKRKAKAVVEKARVKKVKEDYPAERAKQAEFLSIELSDSDLEGEDE